MHALGWTLGGVLLVLLATAAWLVIGYWVIRLAVRHGIRDSGVLDELREVREILLIDP